LDLDFVVHPDAGPATSWASRAQDGTPLELGGPRGSRLAPSGFRNVILVADASGTPALRRWLLAYRGVARVKAILFGPDARLADYFSDHERQLAGIEDAWSDASLLFDSVTGQDIDGDTFVWAAGEANALIPIRSWLKNEKGLRAPNLSLHGYWRAGEAGLGDHAPIDPSDPD
jgi:NADPH-dependent ferric siderophore reductase